MNSNKENYRPRGLSLKLIGLLISIFAFLVSGTLIASLSLISYENQIVTKANENYIALKDASNDIQAASDDLTNNVRLFVANGDEKYMDEYFREVNITQRKEKALETIDTLSQGTNKHEEIHGSIVLALEESNELMVHELYAMKLICLDNGISYDKYPQVAAANTDSVPPENRKSEALRAVLGPSYIAKKDSVSYYITAAIEVIDELMHDNGVRAADSLQRLIFFQTIIIIVIVIFVAAVIIFMYLYVIRPMNAAVKAINNRENMNVQGSREFNYLADTYNDIRTQNEKVRERLLYESEHDKLTGLYNRTGYVSIYRGLDLSNTTYILFDADDFKGINDKYGHEIGDKVLVRVAKTLEKYFKNDHTYVFRIGGDEFSVLIENSDEEMLEDIKNKCEKVNDELSVARGRIPAMSFSIGIAQGTYDDTTDTLFKKADEALYKVKKSGKSGVLEHK